MKIDGRLFIVVIIILALIPGACAISIGGGTSVSVSSSSAQGSLVANNNGAISSATITPSAAIAGPIAKFQQTYTVKDASGKSASVYVNVLNAPSGLTYTLKVLPTEGTVATQTQVSAEQWLTVPKADSIKCTATSSYGTLSANIGLEEAKNALVTGDYVTLTGYYGKAVTTGTSVLASQTATSGAANSIKIYDTAKDSSGTYSVNTLLNGISGGKATFARLSETSSAGTTTQVEQKEHVHGTFSSTATGTRTTPAVTKTITRTSNYGTEYDLNMVAKKTTSGPEVSGILGYYVNPTLKIQGAVNAAQSMDTINVAAGTYVENVNINKGLTVKGADSTKTIVDGNKAGSVFSIGTVNHGADVSLSGMTIQNGMAYDGGGIYNSGKLTVTGSIISGNSALNGGGIMNNGGTATVTGSIISGNSATYGGGISNSGTATVTGNIISGNSANSGGGINNGGTATVTGSIISGNSANSGGGINNGGTAAKLTVSGSTISGNTASGGGGILNWQGTATVTGSKILSNSATYGGGIFNWGTATVSGSTISGNSALEGGGIHNRQGTATVTGSTISGNSALKGGGIMNNDGGTATVTSSTISSNSATNGGGIYNDGTATVKGSTISGNSATYGGGVQNYYGTVNLNGGSITGNTAYYAGGGINNYGGTLNQDGGSIISGNFPDDIYYISI